MMNPSRLAGKREKTLKINFILTLLFFACLLMRMLHAPGRLIADNWVIIGLTESIFRTIQNQPLVQVIIVYGPWWCHHSALRLVSPDHRFCFGTLEVPTVLIFR